MNTTKENVLAIAPELSDLINSRALIVQFAINEVAEQTYTITIDGYSYSYTAVEEDTASDIAAALIALIDSELVHITDYGTGVFDIEAATPGTPYVYSTINIGSQVIQANYNAGVLFDLILADVILAVTEEQYSVEQERAQRYLCAHLLTIHDNTRNGSSSGISNLTSEKVGDVEYTRQVLTVDPQNSALYTGTKYGEVFFEITQRRWFRFL